MPGTFGVSETGHEATCELANLLTELNESPRLTEQIGILESNLEKCAAANVDEVRHLTQHGTGVKTDDDIRIHLTKLKAEAKERAAKWGYAKDAKMVDGFGLTLYDCGLIITSLGKFLGYKVYGKANWDKVVLPGQINPEVDGKEKRIPYLGRRGRSDYTWFDGDRCVGVFETDGRGNRRNLHLPTVAPVTIPAHAGTNNLFKLSVPVLLAHFGYIPASRVWILFQVRKEDEDPPFGPKSGWDCTTEDWRLHFGQCTDLTGATVIRDTELFSELFVEYIARNHVGMAVP
jgi:hypothetical protein